MTLTRDQLRSVEELFIYFPTVDTDWGHAVDMFVSWCLEEDFKNKSFYNFVEWVYYDAQGEPVKNIWVKEEDENGEAEFDPKVWDFFFGYGDNYEKFADDWVDQSERADYLEFCK